MKDVEAAMAMDASYNCAQSLLLPFLRKYNIRYSDGLKLASVFGSGMARMQETCGAVTGAFMILGLEYGFTDSKDTKQRELLLEKTKEFIKYFSERHGTLKCRDILNCDINTEEGLRKHKEENQRENICKNCIRYSASTLEKIIGLKAGE